MKSFIIFALKEYMSQFFGSNHYPREIILLIITNIPKIRIACGQSHSIILSNQIYVTGSNSFGQLGLADRIDRSSFIRLGRFRICQHLS